MVVHSYPAIHADHFMHINKVDIYPLQHTDGAIHYCHRNNGSCAKRIYPCSYTDSGLFGAGECSAFPMIVGETQDTCLIMAREFAKLWIGQEALDIPARLQQLNDFTAGNTTIKSAFDMVLYDIAAKNAGLPLYKFLGGVKRNVETDITIGISSPELMAEKAAAFKMSGAQLLKVKLGKAAAEDVERIKQIRFVVGNEMKIRIDANQGWDFDDAIYALKKIGKI